MKRHEFVTNTSEFGNLVYIMRFGEFTTRETVCMRHFCFIILAGTDGPSPQISWTSSCSSSSSITPWSGLLPRKRSQRRFRLLGKDPLPNGARGILLGA